MAIDDTTGKVEPAQVPAPKDNTGALARGFTDAFLDLAGVAQAQPAPMANTTRPVRQVQIELEEPIAPEPEAAQAEARPRAATAREVTAAVHAGVRPAASPPPVPADAGNTAQFSGVPPPTEAELIIAREVTAAAPSMFPAFPEDGPPTLVAAITSEQHPAVAGEIDTFDHTTTGVRPAPRAPAALDARTPGEIPELPPPMPTADTTDEETTGVWNGMPGLNGEENRWMEAGNALPPSEGNEANWTSRFFDKFSSALHGARGVMETLGKGITTAWQSASQKIAEAYGEMRKFFRGLREEGGRKIGQLWTQIDAARRARQIRLPEQAGDQTAVISRPERSLLRSPAALIVGAVFAGGGVGTAVHHYYLAEKIAAMRRDQGGFTERADNGGPQEVVHAQTPRIPTLGPGAAPPERPMPQAAAKPPQPKPVTVSPQEKLPVKPPRTIVLNCDIQGGIPGCCLPKGTECKPVPPDMLDKDRFDRAKSRITGIIRGRLSVLHDGVEYVSRDPIAFRSGEELIRLDRIEFVERSK